MDANKKIRDYWRSLAVEFFFAEKAKISLLIE